MIKAYIIITKSLYFYNSQLKKYNSGLIFKFYLITYNIIGDVFCNFIQMNKKAKYSILLQKILNFIEMRII